MTDLTPMPVPDALRTAYVQAHARAIAFERRYCELLEAITREQAERTRKQRKPAPSIPLPASELPIPIGLGWQPLWAFTGNGDGASGGQTETGLPVRNDYVPAPKVKPRMIRTLAKADWRALSRGNAA